MLTKTVKTRVSKDDPVATETNVTLDFTGVSQDELQTLAASTVIINQQAIWRTSGIIPKSETIVVRDQLDRERKPFVVTPESLAARAKKLSREELAALVKLLEQK